MLTTEDFAVTIKDLPEFEEYGSVKELKALLWTHLETVIEAEHHQNPQFKADSVKHSQIVNIHFGMTHFGRMKMLLNIYNDMREQLREERRMELQTSEKKKAKHQKTIEKLLKRIDKNIKDYNKYELSHTNKAVVAYVMLRSMEGKERVINAFKAGACRRCCLTYFCC